MSSHDQHGFQMSTPAIGCDAPVRRRVDDLRCIDFNGQRWSLKAVPWAYQGDVVWCRPGDQADALFVSPDRSGEESVCVPMAPDLEKVMGRPTLPDGPLFGRSYVHRPDSEPAPAASCEQCGARVCPRCGAALPHATGATA